MVNKDAPDGVKDILRHDYIRYSGPGGLTGQDDMENWNYAHAASRGVIARRHPYNYEMGLHFPTIDTGYPGVTTDEGITENNARSFYTKWAQVMDAETWTGQLTTAIAQNGPSEGLSETSTASIRKWRK